MLVLTRNIGQSLKLGDDICLTVTCINGGQVRFGITAPKEINIVRSELIDKDRTSSTKKPRTIGNGTPE
ncbi:carbon storage regulator [Nitrincola iocasae]|uniref:Translational regulator CsrA n=1 Tax=Nitrincola iocasae TaxID=2614693 RepID=A0A5J6LG23_9GAMM|nr:carbon storage regulator [Nitrincola iocasae]QEW07549.1 carbon storage regulator [Nitrincola iocasae]